MEYPNVLVLSDFSKDSREAVTAAVDFARKYGSRLTLLNVVRDTDNLTYVLSDSEYHMLERKLEKHAQEQFDKLETRTRHRDLSAPGGLGEKTILRWLQDRMIPNGRPPQLA